MAVWPVLGRFTVSAVGSLVTIRHVNVKLRDSLGNSATTHRDAATIMSRQGNTLKLEIMKPAGRTWHAWVHRVLPERFPGKLQDSQVIDILQPMPTAKIPSLK